MSNQAAKFALPDLPHPEFLRKKAKSRLATLRMSMPSAKLAYVQLVMAREHGFPNWASFQAEVTRRHESPHGQWGHIRRSPLAVRQPLGAPADMAAEPHFLHVGAATQIGFVLAALVGVALVVMVGGDFPAIAKQLAMLAHH